MTDDEFSTLSRRLLTSFPNINAWLSSNSPDPRETLSAWRDLLRACRLDECLMVVSDWFTGKQHPPNQYELQRTALLIRDAVMNDRDREAKRQESDRRVLTYEERKRQVERRRAGYDPLPQTGSMMAAVDEGNAVMVRHRAGEITKAEADRLINEIVNRHIPLDKNRILPLPTPTH